MERVQYLFKLKNLLEAKFEELSRTITMENGKTLEESRGEMRRAIENVEVACGIPTLMQGYNSEDTARGIDEFMIRQPDGVAAPMAFFPFSGWRESFFCTLHGQGRDAVEFFTQEKVVVERWPKE